MMSSAESLTTKAPISPQQHNDRYCFGKVRRNIFNNAAYSIFKSSEAVSRTENSDPSTKADSKNKDTRRMNHSDSLCEAKNRIKNNSNRKNRCFDHADNFYKKVELKSQNKNLHNSDTNQNFNSFLHRSFSADNFVVQQRGYKPSDIHDPKKRSFLEGLTSKILHHDMESGRSTPLNLQKLLTPASDFVEAKHSIKNKKMFASSYFYAPTHPTVEDQVELARRISNSLSDIKNVRSKGQSMYVNRKKRSVKWIHDGNGSEEVDEPSSPVQNKEKVPLKCMMNPNGKILDINTLGDEVNIQTTPQHAERLYDIVRDLNNQKGRGAEIFAKRRKRSEKWVVDPEQPPPLSYDYGKTSNYLAKQEMNKNTKINHKSTYNPHVDGISMDYLTPHKTTAKTLYGNNLYHGPKVSNYQNLINYNTAPRGWDRSQPIYRPIRFEKPQDQKISYSDF